MNTPTDPDVDAAIARVLAAEAAANAAVDQARAQAQVQLEQARADARKIGERGNWRLQQLSRRIASRADQEVLRLQALPTIQASVCTIDPERLQRAAMAVAAELSGGSP